MSDHFPRLSGPLAAVIDSTRHPVRFARFLYMRQVMRSGAFPLDAPVGAIAGTPTKRLVVVGEATAAGYGTVSHQLGIAGHLARVLATRDRVGVSWEVAPFPDLTVRTAGKGMSDGTLFAGADVVVVMLGVGDAIRMTSTATWERLLGDSLGRLDALLPCGAEVVIAEIPPLDGVALLPRAIRPIAGRRALALNLATAGMVRDRNRYSVGRFPRAEVPHLAAADPKRISSIYRAWAVSLLSPARDR